MLKDLPLFVSFFFIAITLVTLVLFIAAVNKNNRRKTVSIVLISILVWLTLHALLAIQGFYTVTGGFPPRFVLLVFPMFLIILILFLTRSGRRFIDSLPAGTLTGLHTVRIFVEIVLFLLCTYKFIPQLMTFEGRNFDIVSGLTAPFIAYFGFVKHKLGKNLLLVWNFACLLLLLNIVVNAVLSAPFRFQQFAFDQPNVAVLYFPFVWLPCFIVPVVLFSHLAVIRKLLKTPAP